MEASTHGREFYQLLKFVKYPKTNKYQPSSFDYLFENNTEGIDLLQWLKHVTGDETYVSEQQLLEYEDWVTSGNRALDGAELEMAYSDFLEKHGFEETEEDMQLEIAFLETHKRSLQNEQKSLHSIHESLNEALTNIPDLPKSSYPRLKVTSGAEFLDLPLQKLSENIANAQGRVVSSSMFANIRLSDMMLCETDLTSATLSCANHLERFVSELSDFWEEKSNSYADFGYIYSQLPELSDKMFTAQLIKAEVEAELKFLTEELNYILYSGGQVAEEVEKTTAVKQQELDHLVEGMNELKGSAAATKKQNYASMADSVLRKELLKLEESKLLVLSKLRDLSSESQMQYCRLQLVTNLVEHENAQLKALKVLYSRAGKILTVVPFTDRISLLSENLKLLIEDPKPGSTGKLLEICNLTEYAQKVGAEHSISEFVLQSSEICAQVLPWFDKSWANKITVGLEAIERAVFGKAGTRGSAIVRDIAVDRPLSDLETAARAFEGEMKKLIKVHAKYTKDVSESRSLRAKRLAWITFLTDPAEFRRMYRIGL